MLEAPMSALPLPAWGSSFEPSCSDSRSATELPRNRPVEIYALEVLRTGAVAVEITVVVPRVRVSPVTIRFVDFVESFVLIAILPLAAGVMNLYSFMRHL